MLKKTQEKVVHREQEMDLEAGKRAASSCVNDNQSKQATF